MIMIAFLTPVLVLIAFILLLLVSLSAPIIKSIYLFRLSASVSSSLFRSGANASVNFGVWGYCISAIKVVVAGINRSKDGRCSKAHLGYTIDSTVADVLNADELLDLISRTTTGVLVLHPLAAGLAFLTLLISIFILRHGSNGTSRLPSFITLGVGSLTAFVTTLVFLIDVILVAIIRKRVRKATDGEVDLVWGSAVWMTLGAAVALWASITGACLGCSRRRKSTTY